ncbi:MAG: hypothetical protein KF790_04545 [Steroidobacteraceae bacterium]|nr:hypothetical protein [Steroidobacteraceae bacterium]MCW5574238.1 hypothetical protein [Steroidobacteraceae bacterium]
MRRNLPKARAAAYASAGVVLLVGLLAMVAATTWGTRRRRRLHDEKMQLRHDEALENTFPASDPPATQYFGIPANRRARRKTKAH